VGGGGGVMDLMEESSSSPAGLLYLSSSLLSSSAGLLCLVVEAEEGELVCESVDVGSGGEESTGKCLIWMFCGSLVSLIFFVVLLWTEKSVESSSVSILDRTLSMSMSTSDGTKEESSSEGVFVLVNGGVELDGKEGLAVDSFEDLVVV